MRKTKIGKILIIFLFVAGCFSQAAHAQKIRYTAEGKMITGKENGKKITKLIDRVTFTQKNTTVYCDSAIFYKKDNLMEAFGHVRIEDGDSVTITGETLTYDGNARQAKLRDNVVYTSGPRRLFTDILDYNLDTKIAAFFDGGKLLDENNTLTSETGFYYDLIDQAIFYTNVDLKAKTFDLDSDTLKYNTSTKIAVTEGYTVINTDKGEEIISTGGEYRTVYDQVDLVDGKVETIDYFLEGEELYYDDFRKYNRAIDDVKLIAKDKDVVITGEEGYYDKANGLSKIFGNPVMRKIMSVDTFYLSADTLVAIESEYDSAKRILAYPNVKIFKSNLQGLTDSLAYFQSDSLIFLYDSPLLWTGGNQIEADTISLEIKGQELDKMNLYKNSFLVSQDTLLQFNQVKGRNMIASFWERNIKNIEVIGNGESLYYALTPDKSAMLAINRVLCSNMMIRFKGKTLASISFYKQPEGKTIPPHEMTEADKQLEGFSWQGENRPTLVEILGEVEEPIIDEENNEPKVIPNAEIDREVIQKKLNPQKLIQSTEEENN